MTLVTPESTRVLVVDDDRGTRLLMTRKLQRDGYVVVEATDGRSAIAMYERRRPAFNTKTPRKA